MLSSTLLLEKEAVVFISHTVSMLYKCSGQCSAHIGRTVDDDIVDVLVFIPESQL